MGHRCRQDLAADNGLTDEKEWNRVAIEPSDSWGSSEPDMFLHSLRQMGGSEGVEQGCC